MRQTTTALSLLAWTTLIVGLSRVVSYLIFQGFSFTSWMILGFLKEGSFRFTSTVNELFPYIGQYRPEYGFLIAADWIANVILGLLLLKCSFSIFRNHSRTANKVIVLCLVSIPLLAAMLIYQSIMIESLFASRIRYFVEFDNFPLGFFGSVDSPTYYAYLSGFHLALAIFLLVLTMAIAAIIERKEQTSKQVEK